MTGSLAFSSNSSKRCYIPNKPLSYNTLNSLLVKAANALGLSILVSFLLWLFVLGLKDFPGFLKEQVADYAGRITFFLEASFAAGN